MVENHDRYLERVEYSINENISFPMYLDTLHPKNRLETYKLLGFSSFDNFSSAWLCCTNLSLKAYSTI